MPVVDSSSLTLSAGLLYKLQVTASKLKPRMTVLPRGPLEMSGDTSDGHSWRGPTPGTWRLRSEMLLNVLQQKGWPHGENHLGPVSGAQVEKPSSEP